MFCAFDSLRRVNLFKGRSETLGSKIPHRTVYKRAQNYAFLNEDYEENGDCSTGCFIWCGRPYITSLNNRLSS